MTAAKVSVVTVGGCALGSAIAECLAAAVPIWKDHLGGNVLNLGPRPLAFASSKAGIVGQKHPLAELGRHDAIVNAVAPSTVPTPMVAANRTPADYQRHLEHVGKLPLVPRVATTEDVANAVRFVACTESGFVTGEILHVAGGYHLAPSGWS